ncbi:MAG: hypothetical protein ACU84Q_13015 [Gammaproteobacteria bacterium]
MSVFPDQFSDLEPLSDWAGFNESIRVERRRGATPEELKSFYNTVKPRLETILEYLDGFPLHNMPAAEEKLLHLALMMVEVAVAVEKFDAVGVVPLAIPPQQFKPVDNSK